MSKCLFVQQCWLKIRSTRETLRKYIGSRFDFLKIQTKYKVLGVEIFKKLLSGDSDVCQAWEARYSLEHVAMEVKIKAQLPGGLVDYNSKKSSGI